MKSYSIFILLALVGTALVAEEPAAINVDEAIAQLSGADFDARERAVAGLVKAGESAREKLEALLARKDIDPEVATRARKILFEQEKLRALVQREQNAAAYKQYQPQIEKLRQTHKGKWLAIAGGKLLALNPDGEPVPAATMQDADAAANKLFPRAAQRFVFQLGDEGDIKQDLGATNNPFVVGNAFLAALPGEGWTVADGVFHVLAGKRNIEIGVKGPDGRPHVEPELLAPLGAVSARQLFIVATGFEGMAILPQELADTLRLARWEIPGKAEIEGIVVSGTCRRAYAQLRFKALPDPLLLPVLIWEKQK